MVGAVSWGHVTFPQLAYGVTLVWSIYCGTCPWSGFATGIERFYIPEVHSRWLQVIPPRSTIVVTLNRSGQGLVKAFLPEGQPYEEWIQKKKAEFQTPP